MAVIERLKLKNFKSFMNANVPLSQGYTTIVGANGSGKSNLVDAICFVLGSTSVKTLRGERLVDLVHASAKEPKATVELTIRDNDDTHKVVREIDKKGNSVFRLNDRRTTLNQVAELLSKLNIHADGHNLIMQGDIAKIIKMSPAQRREIIDEVSGIAEYESKKNESMKELGKVSEKLKESDIVLSERTAYLNVLEKEKGEAEKYKTLNEDVKVLKASIARADLKLAETAFETNKAFVENANERTQKFEERQKESEKEANELEEQTKALNKKIFDESNERQKGVQAEIEDVKSKIAVIEERLRTSKEITENSSFKRQALSKEVSDIGNRVGEQEKKLDNLFLEIDEVKKQANEKQTLLDEINKKAGKFDTDIGSKYKKLESINEVIEKKKEELHGLGLEVKSLTERFNLKRAAAESKDSEVAKFEERKNEIKTRIDELTKKEIELETEFRKIENEFNDKSKLQATIAEKLGALDKELVRSSNKINALDSKISVVRHMTGRGKAVEAILKNQTLRGVRGTIQDLCSFKPEYNTAVNAAAGNRINCIVTETKDDAIEALDYLKKNKLGTATFIPLDSVEFDEEPKGKTVLSLIKYNQNLDSVFKYVFGNTLLINKIDSAKNLESKSRLVTFDGDIVEIDGLISGGYTKELVTLEEIEELEKLKKFVEDGERDKVKSLRELEKTKSEFAKTQDRKTELELKLNEASVVLKQWKNRLDEYEQAYKEAMGTSKGSLKELGGMEGAIQEKQEKYAALEREVNEMVSDRFKLKKIFDNPEVKELNSQINSYAAEVSEIKEKEQQLRMQVSEIKTEIEKVLAANRKALEQQIKEIDAQNILLIKANKELELQRSSLVKDLKSKEEQIRKLATSMTDLFNQKEELESKKKTVWSRLGRYTSEIQKLREQVTEKETEYKELENRYNALKNAYKSIKDVQIIDKPLNILKAQLETSEARLAELGYVNMKALEMYEEYKKEVEIVKEKTSKLIEEKQSIMNLVDEIESKKAKSFMDTFKALNENFNKYYQQFYPEEGTYAKLSLDNEQEPLQAGLILEAQPASKRIKSLEAMSGGEKVVTALAFLFAIQAYKPSPFYVLDEVDAALDKENSERVARMFKKFAREIQLIIVTHNPHVTKVSDQIVGVHMNKEGSSVIEIDLKNYVPPAEAIMQK